MPSRSHRGPLVVVLDSLDDRRVIVVDDLRVSRCGLLSVGWDTYLVVPFINGAPGPRPPFALTMQGRTSVGVVAEQDADGPVYSPGDGFADLGSKPKSIVHVALSMKPSKPMNRCPQTCPISCSLSQMVLTLGWERGKSSLDGAVLVHAPPSRRRSYHLSTPLSGLGSENSGQTLMSHSVRTGSYQVTRFRDRGPEPWVGESLESQPPRSDSTGESQTRSPRI